MNDTIARLRDAVNRHDPQGMAAVFAPDYRSEQPVHPNRGFGGRDQVAVNWTQMFEGIPDLVAEVVEETVADATTWTEWVYRGTYRDGTPFLTKGVTLFGLADDGRIAWGRLYLEPVEQNSAPIDEAVRQLSGAARE
jgi:hypothetical protein